MTPVTSMAGRKVALFGLGGSGIATALALQAGGADVVTWDDNAASLDKARAQGIATADLRHAEWSTFASLVLAPGVPLTHPAPHWTVGLARAAGVEIIGDIELFCRERRAIAPGSPFVAITGTNGKSTTTALVSHILRQAGRDVQMGGNIGTAILSLALPSPFRVHVIEMSSFQIDLAPSLDPTIGVLLNITPDHLDRHGTMENYAAIKERVAACARIAVAGVDDSLTEAVTLRCALVKNGFARAISADRPVDEGVFARGAELVAAAGGETFVVADLAGIASLRGGHNAQNAAAAAAVSLALGLSAGEIEAGFRTFPGLAHRMQEIGRLGRTIFVNDSKATNADSTEKALLSFPGGIHWILGGKPKEGGIESLQPFFTKIDKAYLIGEATEAFAVTLDGAVPYVKCGTLDRAVAAAAQDASRSDAPEPVVLLSPACASYDQYRNFEIRGDHFGELVRALHGVEMRS